jgi:hypothetical protein
LDPEFLKVEQADLEAALKASMQVEEQRNQIINEEEEIMRMVMEASLKEE